MSDDKKKKDDAPEEPVEETPAGPPTLAEELALAAESEERAIRSIFHPDMSAVLNVWNPSTDERHTLLGDQRFVVFESYMKPKGFRIVEDANPLPGGVLNRENPPPTDDELEEEKRQKAEALHDAAQAEAEAVRKAAEKAKAEQAKADEAAAKAAAKEAEKAKES